MKAVVPYLLIAILILSLGPAPKKNQKDYTRFVGALTNKEGTIDLHTNSDSLRIYFSSLGERLKSAENLTEQFRLYSSTLSKIQCGHTQIYPNKNLLREWLRAEKSIPIDLYLIGNRLFVNKLDKNDLVNLDFKTQKLLKSIPDKSEVLKIDDLGVAELMNLIAPYVSSDEDQIEFKRYQVAQYFEFYRHISGHTLSDSVSITYVNQFDTLVKKLPVGRAPATTMRHRIYNYSSQSKLAESQIGEFKILENEYGYFRFKSFISGAGNQYDVFLERSFSRLKQNQIKKLVIDLRGNLGGVMQYDLMSYFIGSGKNLGYYSVEKTHRNSKNKYIRKFEIPYLKHKLISRSQNRLISLGLFNNGLILTPDTDTSLIYKGAIVVITDEGTFSSAAMLACHLKSLSGAKIVGRTAGGSFYRGNSGTLSVSLPESGFTLYVNPNTFYSHLQFEGDPRNIKTPDLELSPAITDRRKLDEYYYLEAIKLFE